MEELHPVVNEVLSLLVPLEGNDQAPWDLTAEAGDYIAAVLEELSAGDREEFHKAVEALTTFALFLEDEEDSVEASQILLAILNSNPTLQQYAAEAAQEEASEHLNQIGNDFNAFVDTRSKAETAIESDEPKVSALDLLRVRVAG